MRVWLGLFPEKGATMTKEIDVRLEQITKLLAKFDEQKLKRGQTRSIPVNQEVVQAKLRGLGWTQQNLADRSGLALGTVKRMLQKEEASFETVKCICSSLKLEPQEIVSDEYHRVFLAFVAADKAIQSILGGMGKWGWKEATEVMTLLLTRNAAGVARRTKNLEAGEELIAVACDFAKKAFPEYVFPKQPHTAPDKLNQLRSKVGEAIVINKGVASATEAADAAIHEALQEHGSWGLTEATVVLSLLLNRFAAGCARETAKDDSGFYLLDGIRHCARMYFEDQSEANHGDVAVPVPGRSYGALEIHGNLPQHGIWIKSGVDAADNAIHETFSLHGQWGMVEVIAALACLLTRFARGNTSNAPEAIKGGDIIEGTCRWAYIHFEDYVPKVMVDDIPGPDRVVAGPDPRWAYSGVAD